MTSARRPAGDLIEAVVQNMRANLEELRYSTIAPSRYTVYLSPKEFQRLQGLIPRLRAETVRALDEELARLDRRLSSRRAIGRLFGRRRPLEHAHGYSAVKHQRFVGTKYFDEVATVVSGGMSCTTALKGSTEEEQFVEPDGREDSLGSEVPPPVGGNGDSGNGNRPAARERYSEAEPVLTGADSEM